MYTQIMTVTPQMAKSWLETTELNRKIRQHTVAQYADDMKNGRWNLTHQGIAFDKAGHLIDGQHRLAAVIRSETPVQMLVSFDVDDSCYLDSGLRRSVSDAMYMSGEVSANSRFLSTSVQALIGFLVKRASAYEYKLLTPEKRFNIYCHYRQDFDRLFSVVFTKTGQRGAQTIKNSTSASFRYAVLCAYKAGVDIDTLKSWHLMVRSGEPWDEYDRTEKSYRSVILFRNWLAEAHCHDGKDEVEIIAKTEGSIRHFVNHEYVTRIVGDKCYPDVYVTKEMMYNKMENPAE